MPLPAAERLRIALFTYATQPRGGVVHALELGAALGALGHEVVLTAPDATGTGFFRASGSRCRLVPVRDDRRGLPAFVRRRIEAMLEYWDAVDDRFDVYHAGDGISGNALATLVERGRIPGYLRTVHHVDAFEDPELDALQRRSIVRAARCFVVSEVWRKRVDAEFGCGAAVVPNGVDGQRFRPLSQADRRALRAREGYGDQPLFLSVGGIEERKNSLGILMAHARLRTELPGACLVIVGGASVLDHGAYRRAFERYAGEARDLLGDSVAVRGVVGDEELVALLQAADALVFPSFREGFGLVALEALACGTPVVASALPPFTEYLPEGPALLVDPADPGAIARAMRAALEPARRIAAASAGTALAERFGWIASARRHLEAYGDYLGPQRGYASV